MCAWGEAQSVWQTGAFSLDDSHAFNRCACSQLKHSRSDGRRAWNRGPKQAFSSPEILHLHGVCLFVLLPSVSLKTKRNFRRITHNLKLSGRALRGSEALSGHLPGILPRNRRTALNEQATSTARSFSASWFDPGWRSREEGSGAIIAPIHTRGDTRIPVFDQAPGQDAANRNCRDTRQLDVSLRPVKPLA